MNSIYFNASKIRPMRWLLAAWLCVLVLVCSPLPAVAAVTQIEEYPGQMLYQSRQTLQDQTGNSWQAIAFKRIHPEGSAIVSLRLVGFADEVKFDHTQPLALTTSMGQTLTAKDISSEISQNTPTPPNVAEYDIKSVLPQLQAEIPLHLTLPMVTGSAIELQIPSTAIEEWQAVSVR
ncbi:DUF3122 domain-containing protein [Calothrix sp. PCC 6303]|uniref:DUF3122 domain-containing protein n=1 Tax=Calothrix sp. PCC 6303 TaxID=1170562 RepID=UPI0002A03ED0|nr:DUF3122 domain-containing protein [Calothrix sp. PCC 6303]AFZ00189.1 hypothetical protein Cal6303_1126 [Calothrix sp. PCC 6303]